MNIDEDMFDHGFQEQAEIPEPAVDSTKPIGSGGEPGSLADWTHTPLGPTSHVKMENCVFEESGLRYNEGKIRYDLLPHDAIEALAQHYTIGAMKYADRNWEKGFSWMGCVASLMRHLGLWLSGEDYDVGPNGEWGPYPDQPEIHMKWTGSLHMTCVMWNAAALTTFALRRVGTDDRVKTRKNPQPIER